MLLLSMTAAMPASAHKPSDAYLRIVEQDSVADVTWEIALRDLELLVGLDADADGAITWGEVKNQQSDIASHALSRLTVGRDGRAMPLALDRLLISEHSDGAYAALVLEPISGSGPLTIEYGLLFEIDPTHRGLVLFESEQGRTTAILSPDRPTATLDAASAGPWSTFAEYVVEGVWHIWIGYDHILFLVALLLPAVWVRKAGDGTGRAHWEPAPRFRTAIVAVCKLVTVFTLAHTFTLWLAVSGLVTLPSRPVEAVIAASILVAAAHTLRPVLPLPGWVIAFGFGLIHGFGFAGVLMDLGLARGHLAVSLLGFNLGVELGQLAIVAALFPIFFALRATPFYRRYLVPALCVLISLVAAIWFVERAFNVTLIGL